MKKLISLLLAGLMILSLSACGSKPATTTTAAPTGKMDRLAKIKAAGVLTICTEPYFAPSEFIDPSKTGDDQYVGVDMEFAKVIADKIGVKLDIVPLEFGAVLSGIVEGKYDLAISALGWTLERSETMNLSKGYFTTEKQAEYGFAVQAKDAEKYKDLNAESASALKIITQSGSLQEGLYKLYVKDCKEYKRTSSMVDTYMALAEGKAEAAIVAKSACQLWADANDGKIVVLDYSFPSDPQTAGTRVAATLNDDTDSLIALVNEVIDELTAQGKFFEWRAQYEAYSKSLGL